MLKRLARKLVTVSVLVAALAVVASAPASSTNRTRYCFEAPMEYGCNPNIVCCTSDGECSCG